MPSKAYYIYILECSNGSFYTGYTTDITRRYQEHQQGTSTCKYTRSFPPQKIAACWEHLGQQSNAMKIEALIKKLTRNKKEELILKPMTIKNFFSKEMQVFNCKSIVTDMH